MAGESPDRSKQHESSASSAEATSGSPAAVPGPTRGSAPTPADPRLAVARERAATVRVDQATAVFSTRALKESGSAEGAGEAPDAAETAPEADASPESGAPAESGSAGPSGDARLRAAVAAWVASADEPADAAPDAAGGPRVPSPAKNAPSGSAGTASDGSDAGTESPGGTGSADADADSGADTGEESRKDATAASPSAEDAAAAPASAEGAAGTAAPGKGASRSASGRGDSGTVVLGAAAKGAAAGTASGKDASGTDADGSASGGTAAGTSGNDVPGEDAVAAPGDDASGAPTADTAVPATDSPAATAADKAAPGTGKAAPAADKAAPARGKDAPASGTDVPDSAEGAAGAAKGAEASGKAAGAGPRVDRPTAVFKAVRPSAPAVDQPTTMLKLGDAKPAPADKASEAEPASAAAAETKSAPTGKADPKPVPTGKADPKPVPTGKADAKPAPAGKADAESAPAGTAEAASAPAGKADAPAERTSKFVALKPLDEPAPVKPRTTAPPTAKPPVAPAEATAAIPQVGPERTTQQPLPPKPPLDLLAELTNTPPPPETPVRTFVRRLKIWTPLVLLLAVVFAVAQAVRPLPAPALALTADETYTFKGGDLDLPWPGQGQSAIEVEGVGGVGTDGKQKPAPIASVAKIMTAYVILEEHPLKGNEGGEQITVDQKAEDESKNEDESTAAVSKGQKFTERQMLQMLMIPSGNNAARLLARWDSDSETFVGKMNAAAKKLGMSNTTYTDPSGLEKTTVSTATDQLKLAKAVMQKDVFRSIVGMAKADIPGLDKPIYNNNDLLVKQVGVIGLKTGSSTPAGGNLVWAATKTVDGRTQTVYGAVLGQNAGTGRVWDSLQLALTNSQKLIDKVQQGLTSATVVKKGDVVGYVDDRLGGRTAVVATKNLKAVGWPGLRTRLSIGPGEETVPHSAKAGTVVGELTVGDGSDHAVDIPVALRSDLAEPGFGAKLTRVS